MFVTSERWESCEEARFVCLRIGDDMFVVSGNDFSDTVMRTQ